MKYLLVFIVLFIAIWLFRKGQREEEREAARKTRPVPPKAPPTVGAPQAMLRCAQCGLHLPATDAIAGPDGVYCSVAHRRAAESTR
ncbi:PP0621 family protein [Variovorax sp. LG9.2]|uniref:PP0621 family protein n=1 Tax=Variovorax sp. LG9.2 TaxID=3048626 RepID=UPI002B228361|nr:PP0621 family protein [Variovorax sp. LG9.2]MEB0055393.1 PP0621 family protein [Variovorax sp. LG9.2]